MMNGTKLFLLAVLAMGLAGPLAAVEAAAGNPGGVDFSTNRTPAEKHYRFETDYHNYALDGTRKGTEKVVMECRVTVDETGGQELECLKFELVDNEGVVGSIPKLKGWKNRFELAADEVLGVTHADFLGLATGDGAPLSPHLEHRVYNTFIDFYAFNNVFGRPAPKGTGLDIGDLTSMGQEIEHYSAYSKPPADLGEAVQKGSYFKNGRVTLQWLGTGLVDQKHCAIVRFDSGESSFLMLMEPIPGTPVRVKGGSHYWGDLFVNLADYWVERATFTEIVIAEIVFGKNSPDFTLVKRLGTIALIK